MTAFVSLTIGEPIPADGEFEMIHEGKSYAVVHHPRNTGWMAFIPPKDWRCSPMKKFAKRIAAVRWVQTAIDSIDKK